MYASRCFRGSQGKLGCISCHDPHVLPSPDERAAYYRSRCLGCHDETSCSLPPAVRRAKHKDDACSACHMPRLGGLDIAHTAETDHRILRDAAAPPPAADGTGTDSYLIPFHADLADPGDRDDPRDMALALASVAEHRPPDALRFQLAKRALPLLEQALRQAPEDVPCLHAKGIALRIGGESEAALAALEAALALAPRRELTLVEAASAAAAVDRDDLALAYWQRALQVNPWCASIHVAMAKFLSQRRRWDEALRHCQAALRLDPADLDTGLLQVSCYLSLGQRDRARTEFDRILRFEPPNQEELKVWFSQQLAGR
jgi:predicted CXXCH cytochrome family protein